MNPLRIILVMVEAPLPSGNPAARWYYVLFRSLVERGHQVIAFAASSKTSEIEEACRLFPAPQYDLRVYPFPPRSGARSKWESFRRPYSYMFSPELKQALAHELRNGFDVLHLESLSSGWVGLNHVDRAVVNVHFLYAIDLEEAENSRVEKWLMRKAERQLLRSYPHIITLSDRLAARIRQIQPQAEVAVVPLGIDSSLYPFIPDERRTTDPVISVIGNMGWYPSRSAADRLLDRLWPEIKQRVPEARVQVVGWEARKALSRHIGQPGVTILEDVPDIRPYFEGTGVLVYAPGRGSGMKVKILESFGYGIPVVTTSEGVEGLQAVDGIHAGICDDDAGLIDRTVTLLRDPSRQHRQRAAARRLLETDCGPSPTVDALESVYRSFLPRQGVGDDGHAIELGISGRGRPVRDATVVNGRRS